MSGKKVNVTIGICIILLAIYMIILPINIEESVDYNRYENIVINFFDISKYVLVLLFSLVSIIFAIANRKESGLRNSYLLFPLVIIGFVVPLKFLSFIALLSGLLVINYTLKKNYVAIDSYFVFSIFIILAIVIFSLIILTFFLSNISTVIKEEIEKDIGIINYDKEFFKYISPIENESAYINLSIRQER